MKHLSIRTFIVSAQKKIVEADIIRFNDNYYNLGAAYTTTTPPLLFPFLRA